MKRKYYIVPIFGCVDPESLVGPFYTYAGMLRRARKIHAKQDEDDAIFWLRVDNGKPVFESFSGAELETEDVCGSCGSGLKDAKGNCAKCGL